MQKKRIATILLFITVIAIVAVAVILNNKEAGVIKLGTAAKGGVYNMLGSKISEYAKTKDMAIEIKTTNGSAANVRLLSDGYLDIAFAQADVVNDAYNGMGSFSQKYQGYSAVTGMYTESCHIIVRTDSNIGNVNDLIGKKINVGEEESGSRQNAYQILSAFGLSTNMYEETNYNYADAVDKLKKGEISAIFVTVGAGAEIITGLANECDIKLLSIDDSVVKRLTDAYKFYEPVVIKSGTYKNQLEDVKSIGVKSILIASDKLSNDKVKQIYELVKDAVGVDSDASGIPIPFHKGVK